MGITFRRENPDDGFDEFNGPKRERELTPEERKEIGEAYFRGASLGPDPSKSSYVSTTFSIPLWAFKEAIGDILPDQDPIRALTACRAIHPRKLIALKEGKPVTLNSAYVSGLAKRLGLDSEMVIAECMHRMMPFESED